MDEIGLILLLQGLGAWLTAPMKALTFLGTLEFHLLYTSALYWCVDATLGMRVATVLLLSGGLNEALKITFRAPRPYWVDARVQALDAEKSFAFPSGHSQHAAGVFGLLTTSWRAVRRVLLALIVLIGLSRLYLAVHWPRDVLAGWLIGVAVLVLYLRAESSVVAWLRAQPLPLRLIVAAAPSLAVITLSAVTFAATSGWRLPSEWAADALARTGEVIHPLSRDNLVGVAGVLLGALCSWAVTSFRPPMQASGSLGQRLARYLVGWAGLALLWLLTGWLLAPVTQLWPLPALYVRTVLVGVWFSVAAPWVFLRLGLASNRPAGAPQRA